VALVAVIGAGNPGIVGENTEKQSPVAAQPQYILDNSMGTLLGAKIL
jgi:hypothetical protein